MRLLHWVHDRAFALLVTVAVLAAAGVLVVIDMPLAIFPSVTFPVIKVIADVGDEPAARMMPSVTRPLEQEMLAIPGVRTVRSTTSRGSSELSANFEWGTDMQVALQRVQDGVSRVRPDLPADAKIDVALMNTALFPILGYALTSEKRSEADLWELAEYTLKPELVRIPGVSQVQIQGGRQREFQVRLDLGALAARRLAVSDVITAIRKNNQVLSAGRVESNHELYLSLVDGVVTDTDSIGRIAVPVPGGGVPALVRELGAVKVAEAVSYIRTTADGRPAVLVNLTRQPTANTVAIARGVRDLFASRPDLIAKDVRWTTFYDQAEFVSQSILGVRDAIVIGVVLAALVLLVFLRNLRLTLLSVAAVPLTVAVVLLALGLTGQTINLMTLGGIAAALGLIADDAIVVAESIARHRDEGSHAPAMTGLKAILRPLIGSSVSTIVIFLPFALLTGVTGAFFQPLALTMGLALTLSFFLAAMAVPAALRALGGAHPRSPRAEAGHSPRIPFLFRYPWLAGLLCAALLLAGHRLYRTLGSDFLPAMDEGAIILDYWTPPGTSLGDTDAMLSNVEKILLSMPDVRGYSRRTGTQLGFFITEPNRGDFVIRLKSRRGRRGVEEVIADIRARAAAIAPALHTDFGQIVEDNIGDLTGGAPQPIDIRIFGDNQALLQDRAREAAAIVGGIKGVEDVFDGIVIAGPALTVRVPAVGAGTSDGARAAARFGLTTEDVQAAVEPAIVGTTVGNVRIGERLYPLRVFAQDPGGLPSLRLRSPSGALVPLTDVASVSTGAPEAEIDRENLKTYLGVTARLEGRDLGSAIGEIRARLNKSLLLPPSMRFDFGGLYEQQQSSFRELLLVLLGGLLLVAIVLLFEFGDWRAPVLTALIAVAVLTGVFAALAATGMTLNISSFVGAIMMVGIVGENAIFVIHEAREGLRRGVPVQEAWIRAARRRRRPVAMTVLASAFALAPLALALGAGSQLEQPLAIAVIGGFALSGFLVLAVLPALYCALDPRGKLAGDESHRIPPTPLEPPVSG
ncbi:MAG TPA: efflux RND transporter permease subunit [Thermoanaerobaculia bacterium]